MNKKVALVVLVLLLAGMGVVVVNQVMRHSGRSGMSGADGAGPAMTESESADTESPAGEQGAGITGQVSMSSPGDAPAVESGLPAPAPVMPETAPSGMNQAMSGGAVTGMAPAPRFQLEEPGAAVPVAPPASTPPAPMAAAEPEPKPVQTAKAPQPAPAKKSVAKAMSKPVAQKSAAKSAKSAANALQMLAVSVDQGVVSMAVDAQQPIAKVKHFFLKAPWRLVVDLYGNFKLADNPAVPDNETLKSVRLGHHKDKMRVVMDLTGDFSEKTTVEKTSASTVKVVIKP